MVYCNILFKIAKYNKNDKNMNITIKKILPEETLVLREKILRPGQPLNKLVYVGDNNPEAYHSGAFLDDKIVGIASVYLKNKDNDSKENSWQLRGMAVEDFLRGQGVGKKILIDCINHIKLNSGNHLWCNARVGAVNFYKSLGFYITSDKFDIPDIGPHYIMEIDL